MGNTKQKKQQNKQKKQHKKNSAVTFDEDERSNYLKGMIGCKRRRREFYLKKVEKETKDAKKQERLDYKAQRRDELRKAKELLEKLSDRVE